MFLYIVAIIRFVRASVTSFSTQIIFLPPLAFLPYVSPSKSLRVSSQLNPIDRDNKLIVAIKSLPSRDGGLERIGAAGADRSSPFVFHKSQ